MYNILSRRLALQAGRGWFAVPAHGRVIARVRRANARSVGLAARLRMRA
jgi:hypothetical protein